MYTEEDLLSLSGLNHLYYCARRCALIHIEQVWEENRFTAEGRVLHEKADDRHSVSKRGVRVASALPIRSFKLGLSGIADVVEFHPDGTILPVEYKRGKPKKDNCDAVQLCAQALCLEEMLGASIGQGALFYGKTRRRTDVAFTESLRNETRELAEYYHQLIAARKTPKAVYSPKCDGCSLVDICCPKMIGKRSAMRYIEQQIKNA